jgi:hypothetical protein
MKDRGWSDIFLMAVLQLPEKHLEHPDRDEQDFTSIILKVHPHSLKDAKIHGVEFYRLLTSFKKVQLL